jgi:hypothetical protein
LEQADIDFDEMAALAAAILQQRQLRSSGRLFGGFWQGLKKQERHEGIWIGGEQVVTLDYAQMAPRILGTRAQDFCYGDSQTSRAPREPT